MKTIVLLFTTVWLAGQGLAADWQPVPGHLMTRWAKEVAPDNVLPEYPRPQMVRPQWQNLNGLWDYAIVDLDAAQPAQFDGKILVPFCVESALSGVKKPLTGKQRLWYRRTFAAPKLAGGQRLLLHFGAVDWKAKVIVNGKPVGEHTGGYDAFTCDITDAVKCGANELIVSVFDDTGASHQPKGKQHFPAIAKPGGIMYTPCSGIWQTVWLETVPAAHIESLKIVPDVDAGAVSVTVNAKGGGKVKLTALDGSQTIATGVGEAGQPITLKISNAKLWSPDTPFLYDLRVECGKDTVTSYFGMRKIALGKDDKGITRILLNGKFVFQVGFLDQGFWPDGIYTAPTDAALRYDIEITKKLGMNVARKHVKVEPDRWYYWCDKLGLLVWQDMPAGDNRGDAARKQFEIELKNMLAGFWNHPSIIMWVVFNEGWGQYDTPRLTQWVKDFDPSRLVNNASGWTDMRCGDVLDMHNYPGPGAPKPTDGRAAVLGEFGGLGLPMPGHTWVDKSWGYRGTANQAELTKQYIKLLHRAYQLKDAPGLNAVIYTQTTDCETECNGLITYDREIVKPDLEKTAAANRGEFPPMPQPKVIVPAAQKDPVTWRYTFEKPADDWMKPGFDAAAWKEGPAGFGTAGTPGGVVRTEWKTADIWMRREFDLPDAKVNAPALWLHHDEDAEIYLNGVLAAKAPGFSSDYEECEIKPAGRNALKPGRNVIAIHCHQTSGGQFIDAGLVDTSP